MSLTASNLIVSVNKKIHNAKAKLGGDSEIRRILNEAMRILRGEIDLLGLKRQSETFVVYKNIYEYPAPTDLSYDKVIEFVDDSDVNLVFEKTTPKEFYTSRNPELGTSFRRDVVSFENPLGNKLDGVYCVEMENGTPYLLVRHSFDVTTTIAHNCDSYDGNGTWVVSDDATNVRTDTQVYREGSGSVAFDSLGGTTDVSITNSTMTAVDLSSISGKGKVFLFIYLPAVPSSITLRWGSSSSAYWQTSIIARHNGLAFRIGWNLISASYPTSATLGSPVATAVDYAKVTFTFASASVQTGFRIDSLMFTLGRGVSMKYYSKYGVSNSSNTRQEQFTDNSDTTILREDEDDLLILQATQIALKELREFNEAADHLERDLAPMKETYKLKNPSQTELRSYTYYHI